MIDFGKGVALEELPQNQPVAGEAAGEPVVVVRQGDEVFAVGATCTHYGGPLAEGLADGTRLHCPWHHACFDVRTGAPIGPPALKPLPCYQVEQRGGRVVVGGPLHPPAPARRSGAPARIVIAGAGAAGNAAAEMLRREGYGGSITMIGTEPGVPVDRPNLSKDYLAGTAPEEWVPLRDEAFYREQQIELVTGVEIVGGGGREVQTADGRRFPFDGLLIATGAEPIRLDVPGGERIRLLRSLLDSRAIIAAAAGARRAVVIGASFIGLEAAAALRTRNLEVHVVAPGARPLERVLGPELGDFVRAVHQEHGVVFHLGRKPAAVEPQAVVLDDGARVAADLVVAGVGVRPRTKVGELFGCALDRGIRVDEHLETSVPGIYAAGDCARFTDRKGRAMRIEHWAVAEHLGQTAARNLLGDRVPYRATPFFWSQHYDLTIAYVGHAERWDAVEVRGSLRERNAAVAYRQAGRISALATIFRDHDSLAAELAFDRDDPAALEAIFAAVPNG
jgi:NADPH-dependent 2,4-dienoyl-CoA reductase/sulfur reductase-like enzyme/nitrite reductase/ring-hydroxylating ferredoxin subunit